MKQKEISKSKKESLVKVIIFIVRVFARFYKGWFIAYILIQTYIYLTPIYTASLESKLFGIIADNLSNNLSILDHQFLYPLLMLIGFYLLNRIVNIIYGFVDNQIDLRRPIFQDKVIYSKIIQLDPQILEDNSFMKLYTKIRWNVWRVINVIYWIIFIILGTITTIATAYLAAYYDLRLLLWMTLSLIPSFLLEIKFGRRVWNIWNSNSHEKIIYQNYAAYALPRSVGSFIESKIFGYTNYLLGKAVDINERFIKRLSSNLNQRTIQSVLFTIPEYVFIGIALFIMFKDAQTGVFSIGDLYFVFNLIFKFRTSVSLIARYLAKIRSDKDIYLDFYKFMHAKPKIKSGSYKLNIKDPPKIELKGVWFKYPKSKQWVFKGLNLTIYPDEDVALVGKNGAGKTTLLKLILRIYDPNKGKILINGVDIKRIDLQSYYKGVAILGQSFNRPRIKVSENIYIGNTSKPLNKVKVIDAAKKAKIHEKIQNLPAKYDTYLDVSLPKGADLSGGEWQKLAIARTFYRDAKLLILDEPTSAVDALAEEQIFDNIFKYAKDKTEIIVSHRFSTVKKAKRIIVIDNGTIVEQGAHSELMKNKGLYYKMYKAQTK